MIDTSVVRFVTDTAFYVRNELVERGLSVPNVFNYTMSMRASDSTHARFIAAGQFMDKFYPRGRGVLMQFYGLGQAGLTERNDYGHSTLQPF